MNARRKRVRRTVGSVVAIALGDGTYAFGRVLREPLIAFYDWKNPETDDIEAIVSKPIAFTLWVMNHAVTRGTWPVIGQVPLTPDLLTEPLFFKKDPITKKLAIYRSSTGKEIPATRDECAKLECAAVWDPEHVVDRLRDHFSGRPNKWVEMMRP